MEKKGDLLNQLAIISDLIEKINAKTNSNTIVLELSNMEFMRVFDEIQKKYPMKMNKPKNSFTIKINEVDVVFNTNNA